jgi:type IV pilus assembly protein PilW
MKIFRANSSQRGFTLIELMIAMLIGVFLMAGVIQIFLSAKQAYRLQENLSRLQENGRFAMDFLTKDIRMAGYAGCASKMPISNIATPSGTNPNPATIPNAAAATITAPTSGPPVVAGTTRGINGVDGANVTASNWNGAAYSAACGTTIANQCIAGTDVISIQSATSCGGQLTAPVAAGSIQISNTNTCAISANDILLIANCANADIFVANSYASSGAIGYVYGSSSNNIKDLSVAYGTDAEIFNAKLVSYYIRSGVGGVPSLYRIDNTKIAGVTNPVELIEGVENMQILYGVDTDQTPDYVANYYVDATAVANIKIPATGTLGTIATNDSKGTAINPAPSSWTRVVSVRINLLTVTVDNNLTDEPQPYFYNGTTVTKSELLATGARAISVVKTDTSQLCPPAGTNCQLVDDRRIHRVFSSTIAVRNRLP